MPITDDNSLVSSYIRTIENPDSIGFVNNRWYRSPYDANARGFGVDVVYNDTAKKIAEGREGKYLTADEEREIRNNYIDKLQEIIDRKHLPNFSEGNISPRKRTMATGLLYRGDGINTNPDLKKTYYEGTDSDFQNAVSKYYKAKHLPERARLHDEFWKDYDDKMFIGPRQESPSNSKPLSILSYIKADGGKIDEMKTWEDLSIRDKSAMIRTAVNNGIYNLSDIRKAYNEFAEGGPYKPGTIYGRPTEEGLKIVSPEFDALLLGKVATNAAREAAGELLNSGIEGTARQRAAITSRRFGREMTKKNDEIKKWSESFIDDVKTGNYTDVPLDLGALTRNVWETSRYIKNTPERYIENTLPRFYRNVFRRTYNNIKPAVPIIFDNSINEE